MDKSKIKLTEKFTDLLYGRKRKRKPTRPGAMDDDATKRVKRRRNMLKDAMKP